MKFSKRAFIIIRKIFGFCLHRHLKLRRMLLRLLGVKIGKNTRIYTKLFNFDSFFPDLIEIGDNCTISRNTLLITHDYSVDFPMTRFTTMLKGLIIIGNNCFIGVNCIILPGVTIGDNVIIGAGSVVTKSIPSNVTAAGNPAKIIGYTSESHKSLSARQTTYDDTFIKR